MPISGGNLISKVSFNLLRRLILLPWLKRNSVVECCKERAYGASMPVRYIPKKSRDDEKPETCSGSDKPIRSIAKKSHGVGNSYNALSFNDREAKTIPEKSRKDENFEKVLRLSRPNVGVLRSSDPNLFRSHAIGAKKHVCGRTIIREKYATEDQQFLSNPPSDNDSEGDNEIDYHMENMSSDFMEEPDECAEEVEADNGFGQGEENRFLTRKAKQDVDKMAVELLARRAYTAMELRKKLNAKHFPSCIIDQVLHDFQERGLLNDSLYAETYSRSRWCSSFWGPRRIKRELLKKGVCHGDVENAIKLVFEEGEGESDHNSRHGLSKSLMDKLYEQASKRWLRAQDASRDRRKERMVRWLQYRGFDWGAIGAILKRLESEYPL